MKHVSILLVVLVNFLLLPQVFAEESTTEKNDMPPPMKFDRAMGPNGQMGPNGSMGPHGQNGPDGQYGPHGQMGPNGGAMNFGGQNGKYNMNNQSTGNWPRPEDGYSLNQNIQPTGGSKMLPPFGNKGSGTTNQIQFNPPPGMKNEGMKMNSGAMADKQANEVAIRKSTVEYLASLGANTSVFTDEVIADGAQFWKALSGFTDYKEQLAKYMAELRQKNSGSGNMMPPPMKNNKEMKSGSGMIKDDTSMMMSDEKMGERSPQKSERPALTEKAKKSLIEKISKIPDEKREATLEKMLKNSENQLKKAQEKGNKTLIRKLEAIIEIIEDEMGSEDDDAMFDSLMSDA